MNRRRFLATITAALSVPAIAEEYPIALQGFQPDPAFKNLFGDGESCEDFIARTPAVAEAIAAAFPIVGMMTMTEMLNQFAEQVNVRWNMDPFSSTIYFTKAA